MKVLTRIQMLKHSEVDDYCSTQEFQWDPQASAGRDIMQEHMVTESTGTSYYYAESRTARGPG
jgi:hypothetical protein